MIPSFCLPHVPSFVTALRITETFNDLFETDCVKEVHLKQKQWTKTLPDGMEQLVDYNLCFVHFKDSSFNQDILDKCIAKIESDNYFKLFPDKRKDKFWKVFIHTPRKAGLE